MGVEYLGIVENIMDYSELYSAVDRFPNGNIVTGDISFLKFRKNGNIMLIPTKCVTFNVSWNQINEKGFIDGKIITVNDKTYFCRVLTGGNADPAESAGGEWDELIVPIRDEIDSIFEKIKHTICKETYKNNSSSAIARGYSSLDGYAHVTKSSLTSSLGFRPVLIIESTLNNSISDTDLGDISSWEDIVYSIHGGTFDLEEKLDDIVIKSLKTQQDGSGFILDLRQHWDNLSYGKHTIKIICTDKNDTTSTVTITFNKIKQPITTIPITSNLKQAIDHSKEIKKEIEYQSLKLKNNLIEKGVECSDDDKMASLIDRIKNITSISNVECGDDWRFFVIEDEFQGRKNTYEKFGDYSTFIANGGYRFFCDMKVSNGQTAYVKIVHKRNEEELFTQEISTKSVTSYVTQKIDISNIKIGDVVEFYTKVNLNNYSTYVTNYGLSCNINLN